jgi:protein tyrosine phosphatase
MIYKLTERVWWGDRHSIKENSFGAVLNVANNLNFSPTNENPDYDFLSLREDIPYIRLSRGDREAVDSTYMDHLDRSIDLLISMESFPILVHCWEGRHRSPIVAIYIECYLRKRSQGFTTMREFKSLLDKAHSLKENIVQMDFSHSLQKYHEIRNCREI